MFLFVNTRCNRYEIITIFVIIFAFTGPNRPKPPSLVTVDNCLVPLITTETMHHQCSDQQLITTDIVNVLTTSTGRVSICSSSGSGRRRSSLHPLSMTDSDRKKLSCTTWLMQPTPVVSRRSSSYGSTRRTSMPIDRQPIGVYHHQRRPCSTIERPTMLLNPTTTADGIVYERQSLVSLMNAIQQQHDDTTDDTNNYL
jgi:hypothetical protein